MPGVMITQHVEVIPEGMSTPDFTRKPISITIQEGTSNFFNAFIVACTSITVTINIQLSTLLLSFLQENWLYLGQWLLEIRHQL